MRGEKIEIALDEGAESFARRFACVRRGLGAARQLAEKIFEHGPMQPPLIPEVVVEHGLVRAGRRGDFVGARPGQALRGKMLLGGGQDAPRHGRILGFFASAPHRGVPPEAYYSTNWLV